MQSILEYIKKTKPSDYQKEFPDTMDGNIIVNFLEDNGFKEQSYESDGSWTGLMRYIESYPNGRGYISYSKPGNAAYGQWIRFWDKSKPINMSNPIFFILIRGGKIEYSFECSTTRVDIKDISYTEFAEKYMQLFG